MLKDELFLSARDKQFEFDASVASVFDDMINRSVPYYDVSSALITNLLAKRLPCGARVMDLGCSTATTLLLLWQKRPDLLLFGIDEASAMIERAQAKCKAFGAEIKLSMGDILAFKPSGYEAIILNYTMQFIRPIRRSELAARICSGLSDGGVFIFSEKIIYEDKRLAKEMIDIYEEYKLAQGYSRYEIAQKREALENVLIPYTEAENRALMLEAGFSHVESVFKWGEFYELYLL